MSDNQIPLDSLDQLIEVRMRIYLAGPLTGCNQQQAEQCRQIRVRTKRVLRTRFTVYDPAEFTPPGTGHSADDVFNEDHTRTSTADLVFFHVNAPSLGVGIESQIAAEATVPRVVAHPRDVRPSRMFLGVFNPTIAIIVYSDAADFERQLLHLLPVITERTKRSAERRRPALEAIAAGHIGRAIFESRIAKKMALQQLAEATDIRECMLRRMERDDAVAATLTLAQWHRLATELGATLAISGSIPCLQGPANEPDVSDLHKESLQSLYDFLKTQDNWVPDGHVFRMWDYAFPLGFGRADAARGDDPAIARTPVNSEEWREILEHVRKDDEEPNLFGPGK